MKFFKRILLVIAAIIIACIVMLFIFISPVTKYLIQRYDKEYTGREISIGGLFLNVFTGNASVSNLTIYEADDKTAFFSCGKMSISITLKKLLKGEYEINYFKLVSPKVNILQNGMSYNFDDVISKFSSADTIKSIEKTSPAIYSINNILVDSGYIYFNNSGINQQVEIKKFNFFCNQISSDNPNSKLQTDFELGTGGIVNTDLDLNLDSLDFKMLLDVSKLNLGYYYAPLRAYMKVSNVKGLLNSKLLLTGNFNEAGAVAASGFISFDDLSIRDSSDVEFTSLKQLAIKIDSLNVMQNIFNFRSILIDEPFFKFDLYNNGDNISRMLVSTGPAADIDTSASAYDYSNAFALIASYVKDIASNYIISSYSADSIEIRNGHFIYDDYTLDDRFTYDISNFNLVSGKISSQNERINLTANSIINKRGSLLASFSVTPDFNHMYIDYTISDIRVTDFNPYSKYYVATPFYNGLMKYESHNEIHNGILKSSNAIKIDDMVAGKKIGKTPVYQLPVRFAVSLLKDVHGNINLDIPVEGDLKDPDYKVGKVIWQIVTNLLLKAISSPVHLIANMFGGNEEELKEMDFNYIQSALEHPQEKSLKGIAEVLNKKSEFNVKITQICDTVNEAEALALFIEKKKYYLSQVIHEQKDSLTIEDITAINAIKNQDTTFNKYLNYELNIAEGALTSPQEKCIRLYGQTQLISDQKELMDKRNQSILNYLTTKGIARDRVKIENSNDPALNFGIVAPKYLIEYSVEE